MAGVALSRLGITPDAFYELTPVEFNLAIKDFDEREVLRIESLIKNNAVMARWQVFHMWNMHGKKLSTPFKLGRFEWEKLKPMTLDQMKQALYAIAGKTYKK